MWFSLHEPCELHDVWRKDLLWGQGWGLVTTQWFEQIQIARGSFWNELCQGSTQLMGQLYPHVKKDNKTINGWTCFNKFILYIHYNFSIGENLGGFTHIWEEPLKFLVRGEFFLPFDPSLSPGTPNNQFFMVVSTFQLDDSKSLHKKWWFQVPGMASSKHLWIAIRVFLRSWGARQVVGVAVKRAGPVGRFVFLWPRSWFFKNPSRKLKLGGGLKHFLFSPLLGEMIQID